MIANAPQHADASASVGPSTWRDFAPGDSLFASPDAVLHGRGCLLRASPRSADAGEATRELLARARALTPRPMVFGLLPFDPALPAQLHVPQAVHHMAFPHDLEDGAPVAVTRRQALPSGRAYEDGVRRALAQLAADPALRKLVLARTLRLDLAAPLDVPRTLARLWRQNPGGHSYALPLGATPGDGLLLGASPELLVERRGRQVLAHPLAGTTARVADPAQDARNAQALLHSHKNRLEHAVVVEAIEAALRPLCHELHIPTQPELTSTARLWHLGTPIVGTLRDPALQATDLALALHPTPAVCGLPTDAARRAIAAIEPFERGYYAGAAGWCDASGDGLWCVAIRCAQLRDQQLTLYAGAGIVPESDPALERAETASKLRTVLDALGLEGAP